MNYIDLINTFWKQLDHVTFYPSDCLLYFYLLNTCYKIQWQQPFYQSDRMLSLATGMSVPTIREAKNRLKQGGIIDYNTPEKKSRSLEGQTKYWFPTVQKTCTVPLPVPFTVPFDGQTGYDTIIDLYHSTCPSLPKLLKLTDSRKEKIKKRVKEIGSMEKLKNLFEKTEQSDFLKGNNNNGWKATFDWLFENETNWIKVLEGNYDNTKIHKNGSGVIGMLQTDLNKF